MFLQVKSVNNVVYVFQSAQMMLFLYVKILYKEKILIMTIAKDVEFVQKYAHSKQ